MLNDSPIPPKQFAMSPILDSHFAFSLIFACHRWNSVRPIRFRALSVNKNGQKFHFGGSIRGQIPSWYYLTSSLASTAYRRGYWLETWHPQCSAESRLAADFART